MDEDYKKFIHKEVKKIDTRIKKYKEKNLDFGCKYETKIEYLEKEKTTLLNSLEV